MSQNDLTGKPASDPIASLKGDLSKFESKLRDLNPRVTSGPSARVLMTDYSRCLNVLSREVVSRPGFPYGEIRQQMGGLVHEWSKRTIDLLPAADDLSLVSIIESFSRLRIVPDDDWSKAWIEATRPRLNQMNGSQLSMILNHASNVFVRPDEEWMAAWRNASVADTPDPVDIASRIESHALRQQAPETSWMESWNRDGSRFEYSLAQSRTIASACKSLDIPRPSWLKIDSGQLYIDHLAHKGRPSFDERSFARTFEKPQFRNRTRGVEIEPEAWCEASLSPVDFALRTRSPAGRPLVLLVQIDGPMHFVANTLGVGFVAPRTAMQTKLIEKGIGADERLLRIDHREFHTSPDRVVERTLDRLQAMSRNAPVSAGKSGKDRFPYDRKALDKKGPAERSMR